MDEIEKARAALRESRDALKAALQADPRWQQLERVEAALRALGDVDGPYVVKAWAEVHPTPMVVRRPAADIEDRGTYPLLQAVMEADPNRVWRIPELVAKMEKEGWETDAENKRNAIGTALLRLHQRESVEKLGRGKYRWAVPDRLGATSSDGPDGNDPDSVPEVDAVEPAPVEATGARRAYESPVDFFDTPGPFEASKPTEAPVSG